MKVVNSTGKSPVIFNRKTVYLWDKYASAKMSGKFRWKRINNNEILVNDKEEVAIL